MQTSFTPSWKKYEEAIYKGDAKTQEEASDKFLAEREHELKTDPQARRWEESRKKAAAKDKPTYIKEKRKNEFKEVNEFRSSMRKFGASDQRLKPAPGYILVVPEVKEQKSVGGIILPEESSQNMANRGIVIEIGDDGITNDGRIVKQPCKKDDLILFKKGAGVEMEIQREKCRFMQFSDILGTFVK